VSLSLTQTKYQRMLRQQLKNEQHIFGRLGLTKYEILSVKLLGNLTED